MLSVRAFYDQYPSSACRVQLTKEKDIFGIPKARIEWEFSGRDIASIQHFSKELGAMFREYDIGKFYSTFGSNSIDWKYVSIHSHFLGAARMGTNETNSVTNSFGLLHDIPNVFVCGPALFPSYGNANPVLSIAAFSLRTGAKIAATMKEW